MRFASLYIICFEVILFGACGNPDSGKTVNGVAPASTEVVGKAEISFTTLINDLGTIKEGEQVVTWFEYSNTGSMPLLINSIKAGCGCTVPTWNKKPLMPGEKENIKVIFNSRGKNGIQSIRISVNSNAVNSEIELRINASVESVN